MIDDPVILYILGVLFIFNMCTYFTPTNVFSNIRRLAVQYNSETAPERERIPKTTELRTIRRQRTTKKVFSCHKHSTVYRTEWRIAKSKLEQMGLKIIMSRLCSWLWKTSAFQLLGGVRGAFKSVYEHS